MTDHGNDVIMLCLADLFNSTRFLHYIFPRNPCEGPNEFPCEKLH